MVPVLTYIGSQSPSLGTVDFTGLSSGYKGYRFYMSALTASGSANLLIRCSTDNGANYDASSIYTTISFFGNSSFDTVSTGCLVASASVGALSINGYVDVYFNNIANSIVTFSGKAFGNTSNGWISGDYMTLSNVNALRFLMSGVQTLLSGTIYQYGIS